jgi:hypothetical protein
VPFWVYVSVSFFVLFGVIEMNATYAWFLGLVSLLISSIAGAAGLADISAAVAFADVATAVIAVAVALAAVYVTMRGAGLVLKAIRGK